MKNIAKVLIISLLISILCVAAVGCKKSVEYDTNYDISFDDLGVSETAIAFDAKLIADPERFLIVTLTVSARSFLSSCALLKL